MNSVLHLGLVDTRGQTAALAVAGELDLFTAADLGRGVEEVLNEYSTVILDLAGVTFCDSSGLNALLHLRRHAQDTGGQLALAAPPAQMLRLLTLTGMDSVFALYGSLAEAWAAHPTPGAPPTA
ncbi:anti-sigma factor antagonist [Streptomyces cinereoruber]|uniref:Anti-sigma factor antagonist n=1 Tax=Streptomyces cinereoruber TaxID=67260 RepID=A0AAV4KRP5_9ACTN|nr:STAS domain-containing protein [Streptomyces cinereoruber]MBB4161723.1 anti-sigma B factor antagonist [Streptomyces cinereoruber]MBY8820040.1 STAS domain-containing protein [Streptomyces cinereoruber]NIH65408.1 anti-sigma B factor antagonist [Streptomyces cinereoruber]QEV30863.1 anti-sigma factor antagonist [Streptomyces cinereoruber]GGR48078.1 anti-sigma factor antagonist [Streptomyces cinereoruber]